MTETNWWPGVIVLALGLLAGGGYLLFFRPRAARKSEKRDEHLVDLDGRVQLLLDQLKELNADRHHLDPQQFAAEKSRLELEAAAAMRARDEYQRGGKPKGPEQAAEAPAAAAEARPPGWWARHPQLKGAAWGGGLVLFFVVLGLLLQQEQKPRGERGEATGRTPPMQAAGDSSSEREDPTLKDALAQLQAHPDNVEVISHVGHLLINREDWEEAGRLTERALGLNPFHIESRIHRAVLMATRGDKPGAIAALEHLTRDYPDAYEGLLFLGALALQDKDPHRALDYFERFVAEAPAREHPPRLREAMMMIRNQLGMPAQ